ncbi:NnrU family protein [Rhodobacter sp. Har01]|uniref:NnrU family protein n=1 Tax=Rhodobacter sp. Har01 TaxID=2883999 RepID=UPI001D07C1CA|nr:NnrU family protein [Rhodobacter sp. Har01]MCB6177406.1 NnrU family protein [Rhodobacter sp. Har01]
MLDWLNFALALGLFLISHRLPAMLGVKARAEEALGARGYTVAFSVGSLALLYWVIVAAGRAPHVELWPPTGWSRWLVNIAMPVAGLLAAFGVAAPNPFAFEGRRAGFDPDRPGIAGLTRQPLLWALVLWSGAHLAANGDLAHVVFFGLMLGFSVAGMGIVERRRRRAMGPAAWLRLTARTGLVPGAALLAGWWRPEGRPSGLRLGLWLLAWAGLWHLHAPVIGFWPGAW